MRRKLLTTALVLLGTLAAYPQERDTKDKLIALPSRTSKHVPIARGDAATEYAKWKALTPQERQAIINKSAYILPLVKQQQLKPFEDAGKYADGHWRELYDQSASASNQPRRPRKEREFLSVRVNGHKLTYPATRARTDTSQSQPMPEMPECGSPPDPDCLCNIYGDCEPSNLPPIATLSASPTSGVAPVTVTFTASASDRDGYITDTFFSFGDGQTLGGVTSATHTYTAPGAYSASFTATDDWGDSTTRTVQIQVTGPPPPPGQDQDGDGVADPLESQVADLFTPYYHVSGSEQSGTAFGIMGDYVPETPVSLHGPVPPYSYYRVKPYGFYTSNGVQYGILRIDYLTLWNRDDGLSASVGCEAGMTLAMGLAGLSYAYLQPVISSHNLDNERSILLVSAPTTAYNTYNTNAYSYTAYAYYTASHEGTPFDQSVWYALNNWPAGYHPEVDLATSKHGTYAGDPDGLVLTPGWIIDSAYFTLDDLYNNGWIDDWTYWSWEFGITEAFYGCIVERFDDRGGAFADVRTNVGEPAYPLNGSHFILDPKVLEKLQ